MRLSDDFDSIPGQVLGVVRVPLRNFSGPGIHDYREGWRMMKARRSPEVINVSARTYKIGRRGGNRFLR